MLCLCTYLGIESRSPGSRIKPQKLWICSFCDLMKLEIQLNLAFQMAPTQDLLEASVRVISKGRCKRRWGRRYHKIIENYMICTKDLVSDLSEVCAVWIFYAVLNLFLILMVGSFLYFYYVEYYSIKPKDFHYSLLQNILINTYQEKNRLRTLNGNLMVAFHNEI